jgi:hypothetical protein
VTVVTKHGEIVVTAITGTETSAKKSPRFEGGD